MDSADTPRLILPATPDDHDPTAYQDQRSHAQGWFHLGRDEFLNSVVPVMVFVLALRGCARWETCR